MSSQILLRPEISLSRRLAGAYAELPVLSGRSFLPISFLGRLPTTMAPLAILTHVASSSGSYSAAGLAAAATAAGTAVGTPLMGRAADRRGQRPVLLAAVVLNAVALSVIARQPFAQGFGLLALCVLAGLSMPSIGGMARARWLAMTARHAGTAMAFEGTADEVAYVVGPALAGMLAAGFGPSSALLVAAGADLVAGGAFALHRTHRLTPVAKQRDPMEDAAARPGLLRALLFPVFGMTLMGAFFAATQSAVTVFAGGAGQPSSGGLIYALMAVGSALTALGSAALPERFGPRSRCLVAAAGLLAGALLMSVAGSIPVLCGAILITGLAVGPMLVTLNQVAGAAAPVRRVATAMAYLSAGSVVGVAVGATAAGALADLDGSRGAFAVVTAASAILLVLCSTGPRGHIDR